MNEMTAAELRQLNETARSMVCCRLSKFQVSPAKNELVDGAISSKKMKEAEPIRRY